MIFRPLLALLFLPACAGGGGHFEMSGQVAAGQVAYVGPALAQARDNFFGDGGGGSGGGGATGGGFGLDEAVTLQGAAPSVVALAWTRQEDLGGDWHLQSALRLSHQEARAYLPEGLGVLTDPMRVRLWAEAAAVEVSLGRTHGAGRGWTWGYAAGVGLQQIAARAHLQSALIDVASRVDLTQPYTVLSGRVSHPAGVGLDGQVLMFQDGGTEFRLGFVQEF